MYFQPDLSKGQDILDLKSRYICEITNLIFISQTEHDSHLLPICSYYIPPGLNMWQLHFPSCSVQYFLDLYLMVPFLSYTTSNPSAYPVRKDFVYIQKSITLNYLYCCDPGSSHHHLSLDLITSTTLNMLFMI